MALNSTCPIHSVEMEEKDGQFGPYWSHKTEDGWCNGKKITPFKNKGGQMYSTPPTSSSKASDGEEPMTRKDWDRKEFIKGLAVFSSNERQQGMSPVEAIKNSHTFDWMFVAYGDNPHYEQWASEALARIKKLGARAKDMEREDKIEAFDRFKKEDIDEDLVED